MALAALVISAGLLAGVLILAVEVESLRRAQRREAEVTVWLEDRIGQKAGGTEP